MAKKSKIQIVAPEGIFFIFESTNAEIRYETINELLLMLKKEYSNWKRLETREKGSLKISSIYKEFEEFIENELFDSIDTDDLVSRNTFREYIVNKGSSFEGDLWSFEWRHQYSAHYPTFQIYLPSYTAEDSDKFKAGYKILKNSTLDTYSFFVSLFSKHGDTVSYLNSGNREKIEAALCFLSVHVQNRAILGLRTDLDGKSEELITQISQTSSTIESARKSFEEETQSYLELQKKLFSEEKEKHQNYITKMEEKLEQLIDERQETLSRLEDSYQQKLALKAPIVFWETESKKYKDSAIKWGVSSVLAGILIAGTGLWMLHIGGSDIAKLRDVSIIPVYFIPIALISLLVYILRTFIKIAISNQHISVEYAQKAALTDYYLSMIQEGHMKISIEEKQLLLPSIFSKIDSGLVKGDSGGDSEATDLLKVLLARK
ncbi:DUF6161 domain-containing protein [Lactococcus petauri]|uniref:DUF6161 domain-containing protein n=1 Tax=Lactococcus petauri TaxID=1940789 RepID=UPI00177B4C99|nr:DUF6161 domain-containing protein [Lactococcus petauri]MBD5824607.1 hypothetical protein [Lactococcus petauri]